MPRLNEARRLADVVRRRTRKRIARHTKRLHSFETLWIKHGYRTKGKYEAAFAPGIIESGLGRDLLDVMRRLAPKNRPLRVWDDGAGDGMPLEHIARDFQKIHPSGVETTATSLIKDKGLAERKRKRVLSHVFFGASEAFVPDRPQDVIFNVSSTVQYGMDHVRKEHLRKLANCLTPNGVLLASFWFKKSPSPREPHYFVARGLSNRAKAGRMLTVTMEMAGITRAFAKQGFRAHFTPLGPAESGGTMFSLIVRRLN